MRRARSLILFLLLGAILNILLTWSLCISLQSLTAARVSSRVTHFDPKPEDWPYAFHDGRKPDQANRATAFAYTMDTGMWGRPPDGFAMAIVNTGLPFRSMRFRYEIRYRLGPSAYTTIPGGWQVHNSIFTATFPFIPIWPGFLLNPLIFASLSWLLLRAPRTIRRTLRKRSHRCLTCGYSRAGLTPTSPCPECGQPLTP